jgi:hypothetical protein
MVDATIIHAPPSTKNRAHARVAEMHQSSPPSSAVRRLILVFWRSEIVALQRVAQVKRRSSVVSRIVIEA